VSFSCDGLVAFVGPDPFDEHRDWNGAAEIQTALLLLLSLLLHFMLHGREEGVAHARCCCCA
jgi:hypothetical protein